MMKNMDNNCLLIMLAVLIICVIACLVSQVILTFEVKNILSDLKEIKSDL